MLLGTQAFAPSRAGSVPVTHSCLPAGAALQGVHSLSPWPYSHGPRKGPQRGTKGIPSTAETGELKTTFPRPP